MNVLGQKGLRLTTKEYFFLFLFLGSVLVIPVMDNKILPGHDYVFHVTRILDVASALHEGIFPVRIYVDDIQFWGTPVGIFYPSLFIYIPALLKLAGVPIEICYNIFVALIFYIGVFSSWYGFYLLTKSKITGLFSSILYVSSGWFLIDAYIRNALGELIALTFLPLAVSCIIEFSVKQKVTINHYILGIISISATIQAHVLSSAFLALFAILFLIIRLKTISSNIIRRLFFLVLIIFCLNSFFIVPFLLFYVKVPVTIDYVDLFSHAGLSVSELLYLLVVSNYWLFISLCSFVLSYIKKYKTAAFFNPKNFYSKSFSHYRKFFLLGILFVFLSSNLMPWGGLSAVKRIFQIMQFPWRFLGIATMFFCVCGGFGLRLFLKRAKLFNKSILLFLLIICLTNLVVLNLVRPLPFEKIPPKVSWERKCSSTDDDYLYKDMNVQKLFAQGNRYYSNAEIFKFKKKLTFVSFSYFARYNSSVTLPLVNYPGYVAVDQHGEIVAIDENENHMMLIPLTQGYGEVHVQYVGLKIFKIADYTSLFTWVLFCGFVLKKCINCYLQKKLVS